MSFGLENLGMLLGLAALAIPVLIHFLQRRRYDVVDWGAMQFLQVKPSVRRRWWWDELLLLLVRMGLLAVLVLALAAPFAQGPWVRDLPGQPRRDVVFILDPSASMGHGKAWERAKEGVAEALGQMQQGDRAALILAGQPATALTPAPTSDLVLITELLKALPEPTGTSDLPRAVELARDMVAKSQDAAGTHIYVLRDRQRSGWTDAQTMAAWESVSSTWPRGKNAPKLSIVPIGEAKVALNFWLAPLHVSLGVTPPRQKSTLTSALHWKGDGTPSGEATFIARLDGTVTQRWSMPLTGAKSPLPLTFSVQPSDPGSHLVTLEVELEAGADALTADNAQHIVLEAVEGLPVLLVDAEDEVSSKGSTFFLESALSDEGKDKGLFSVRRVCAHKLTPDMLFDGARNRHRVVVLGDLPGMTDAQAQGIERFLRQGGSVLVGLGPRSLKHQKFYNALHQEGLGWFPLKIEGSKREEGKLEQAARITASGPAHPALDYFRDPVRGLNQARFPRWIKAGVGEGATSIAFLDVGQPFLVETKVGPGRVLASTVPLDRSWGSDFPSLHAYPILMHRLLLYLAEAGSASWRLSPGQRVAWQPPQGERLELPATLYWQEKNGEPRAFTAERWPWVGPQAGRTGPASLSWGLGKRTWFVVPLDPRESDLTPPSEEEEEALARLIPFEEIASPTEAFMSDGETRPDSVDIWWILLLAVVFFLCAEIWFTRRIAKQQAIP